MQNMNSDVSNSSPHRRARSVLGWPAWLRVVAVLPVVALLWLAVAWAQSEALPW